VDRLRPDPFLPNQFMPPVARGGGVVVLHRT
jgi:hypothetical protein